MKATWNGETIAESDDIVTVEGNAYFPAASVNQAYLKPSDHHTTCPWKGEASYFSLGDDSNAVWSYETPKAGVEAIAGHLAFYPDKVEIERA